MKILTILGSPRTSGHTAFALDWVEQTLRSCQHTVQRVNVAEHRISGCRECLICRDGECELCAIEGDDANRILQQMVEADLLLLASPMFCWGFPAQMKALLDRMFCLVDDYRANPNYATRLAGKPIGLLVTCGGPEEGNAELMIQAFYAMVRFMKARPMGHLLYPFFRTPADLTAHDRQRAAEFALSLIGQPPR